MYQWIELSNGEYACARSPCVLSMALDLATLSIGALDQNWLAATLSPSHLTGDANCVLSMLRRV